MKKKLVSLLSCIMCLLLFSGCVFSADGESLEAFSRRMNVLNENYAMSADGYIIDTENRTFTKFFKYSHNEIMLEFAYDQKNRLTQMNLVFEPVIFEECPDSLDFISNCIISFCQNENTSDEILSKYIVTEKLKTVQPETTSAEAGNIKLEIDTTQLGTVLTLYRDILS